MGQMQTILNQEPSCR